MKELCELCKLKEGKKYYLIDGFDLFLCVECGISNTRRKKNVKTKERN